MCGRLPRRHEGGEEFFCQQEAGRRTDEADNHGKREIRGGALPLPHLEELYRLPGEGGKGGERTEKTGENEEADLLADVGPLGEPPEKADQEAAEQVHHQGAERKHGPGETLHHHEEPVPADGADTAADHDRKHIHRIVGACWRVGNILRNTRVRSHTTNHG